MTQILHIVGPQGSGKSTLAQMIVRGCKGTTAHLDSEEASTLSNSAIRERFAAIDLVCVEASGLTERHGDLKAGDWVLAIHHRTAEKPAPESAEAGHAG